MDINGEAIYGTIPWRVYGENPEKDAPEIGAGMGKFKIYHGAVRFTTKDDTLYAICMTWPTDDKLLIPSIGSDNPLSRKGIRSISVLGVDGKLTWVQRGEGLEVSLPETQPCEHAYVLKIESKGKLIYN